MQVTRLLSITLLFLLAANTLLPAEEVNPNHLVLSVEGLQSALQEAQDRLAGIDVQMERLDRQQQRLRETALRVHRGRFDLYQEIIEEDDDLRTLRAEIAERQAELTVLQEQLSARLEENQEYQRRQAEHTMIVEEHQEIDAQAAGLANQRVAVQLEIQDLERQLERLQAEISGEE